MRPRTWLAAAALLLFAGGTAFAAQQFTFNVKPQEFDPARSHLVQATWLGGIGCPTGIEAQVFQPPTFEETDEETITDSACPTGDPDQDVEGLILAKTGPTANNASAVALITNAPETLTELGWDIRKPGVDTSAGVRGSHCGAGAPRWNVTTVESQGPMGAHGRRFFVACNSPAPEQTPGEGWQRHRWGATAPLLGFSASSGALVNLEGVAVEDLRIVFDEGQDAGPDNFGLAVLDNIDVNGVLVGRGATDGN